MASVTGFVEDAVGGNFPPVCIRTGRPAASIATVRVPVGGPSGALWLLVLLGPVGWLLLFILLAARRGEEVLTVQLPYSKEIEDAFLEHRQQRTLPSSSVWSWGSCWPSLLSCWAIFSGSPRPGLP